MKIINRIFVVSAIVAAMCLCSCGDGAEDLTPSEPYVNFFEVPASDNSASASLRRNFYGDTGIYLLFSDVLAEYTDEYGNDRVEKVDFNWQLTGNRSIRYSFDGLEEDEREKVLSLVSKYFVPYINVEGGQLKPYSILLVKNLMTNERRSSRMEPVAFLNCWRCFCINASDWLEADEETARSLGKSLLSSLVDTKVDEYTPALEPFFAICEQYYREDVSDFFDSWVDEQDVELIYNLGFMRYSEDWYGDPAYDYFLYESNDLADFKKAVFNEDEEDFKEKWADYPLIIRKYDILKETIAELGVDFNAVK